MNPFGDEDDDDDTNPFKSDDDEEPVAIQTKISLQTGQEILQLVMHDDHGGGGFFVNQRNSVSLVVGSSISQPASPVSPRSVRGSLTPATGELVEQQISPKQKPSPLPRRFLSPHGHETERPQSAVEIRSVISPLPPRADGSAGDLSVTPTKRRAPTVPHGDGSVQRSLPSPEKSPALGAKKKLAPPPPAHFLDPRRKSATVSSSNQLRRAAVVVG